MLTLDEARARLFSGVRRVASERIALAGAAGRVLAESLVARWPIPSFDHSAMDGYAVALRDLQGPLPRALPVAGESAAGGVVQSLCPGTANRIFTGAAVPQGADAVVAQEDVERDGDVARFRALPKNGQHIRRAGEDLGEGAVALAAGARLTPGAVALAAMLDQPELAVVRRPRVTVLCTGSELRAVGDRARPGSIADSNGPALAAFARQAGAIVAVAPIAGDDVHRVAEAIDDALRTSDLLVTVGGVSVGDHDVVRPALDQAGVMLDFWKVAIKPGKPIAFGRRAGAWVIGLPGNPASALVTFALFGMPLLRAMQGDARPHAMPLAARLAAGRKRSPDRLELLRAELRRDGASLIAVPHDNQASGAATSLATSEGLALVPPGPTPVEAGAAVEFLRWSDF